MGNGWDMPLRGSHGTPQDGAIEVEENRLAGKSSLCSLGQRLLRRLAKQLEELTARRFLFNPSEHLAGQHRSPNLVQKRGGNPAIAPMSARNAKSTGPSSLWVSNCPAATFENLAAKPPKVTSRG